MIQDEILDRKHLEKTRVQTNLRWKRESKQQNVRKETYASVSSTFLVEIGKNKTSNKLRQIAIQFSWHKCPYKR